MFASIFGGLILFATLCLANEPKDEIRLEEHDPVCSFYCFMLPKKRDSPQSIQDSIKALDNLNCTHIVYGYATIDHYQKIHNANPFDSPMNAYWGTYRKLHELHRKVPKPKLLLAVREQFGVHFVDSATKREVVIRNLINHAEFHYFDGIFFNLRDTLLSSFYFEQFANELNTALDKHATETKKPRLMTVLALNSKDAHYTNRKVKIYADKFNKFYLKGDEALTAESDVQTTILLDPIYTDKDTPFEDTISDMANSLIRNGIIAEKIIVGLSARARGYNLVNSNETFNGAFVYEFAHPQGIAPLEDGRFAYQDICHLPGFDNFEYWKKSVAVSFVDDDDNWYSFNKPNHESFERKVKYIMTHGFGGVGLMHMEADDPYDHCGTGPYPLTNYLSRHLTCTKPKVVHGGSTECKRLCIYRPEYATISFQNLKPEWCSHIVISSAKFNSTGCIEEAASFKNAIVDYNTWSARKKPFLVISIGADMDNENWQSVLKDSNATHVLIDHIWQFYKDSNADGVSIDFVATKISSDIQDNFHVFLENLKKVKPKTAVIFVTVTYVSTISNAYNVQKINSASDYIIIEGYKFHSINEEFTGHHSPLFMTNILPVSTDSLKSIEGLANAWTKRGVPNNKIILGFSAVGQTQPIIMKNPKTRSDDDADEFLRLKTDISDVSTTRSSGPGYISQTELCEALHKSNATNRFYDDISVPVGKVGDDFYAYDDMRSIHTKSVWASLNHFAGVSFYGIENDNPDAICPSTEPFNLLQKIAQSQACEACSNPRPLDETFAKNDKCGAENFRIICNYQLPRGPKSNRLSLGPEMIPYENCSEIIVEEILWMADGKLTFRDIGEQNSLHNLVTFAKTNHVAKKFYLIVRCFMKADELKFLIDNNQTSIETLVELVKRFEFSGVELRCDSALNSENKGIFKSFISQLSNSFNRHSNEPCPETVSVRIPIWNNNLKEKYDISQLNSIHQVVLETFEMEADHARVVSPLFGFDKSNETHAIDSKVSDWIESGIFRHKIVIQVPSYALVQTFLNESIDHNLGDSTEPYFSLISQADLCVKFNQSGDIFHHRMFYDMVSTFATSPYNSISYETNETITYKVKFAIREGLAGIGLLTINQDDYRDVCGKGAFPLLSSIHSAICPKPPNEIEE